LSVQFGKVSAAKVGYAIGYIIGTIIEVVLEVIATGGVAAAVKIVEYTQKLVTGVANATKHAFKAARGVTLDIATTIQTSLSMLFDSLRKGTAIDDLKKWIDELILEIKKALGLVDEVVDDVVKKADDAVEGLRKGVDDLPLEKLKLAKKMWDDFDYKYLLESPPSRKPCFLAGTLVKTENGHKPIEQIVVGDRIYAYDFIIGQTVIMPVSELFKSRCDKYLEIHTSNGVIKATGAHRFWIPAKNKWMKARELTTDQQLLTADGKNVTIEHLKIIEQSETTYNLEVADLHNYFVGEDEVLSHNKSIADSIFASTEVLQVNFYSIDDFLKQPMYVGQTTQRIEVRYGQHKIDPKKAAWVDKMKGVFELSINGKSGPFSMTPYEAAVTELYEINYYKGTTKSTEPFKNKQKPIGNKKFDYFKKNATFNPCLFYV
jgi:hypothetical protein